MKQNTGYVSVRTAMQMLVGIVLFSAGSILTACSSDDDKGKKIKEDGEGRTLELRVTRALTRADAAGDDVMSKLSLFVFDQDQLYNKYFGTQDLSPDGNVITVEMDPGIWDFALVSSADGDISAVMEPTGSTMTDGIMYEMSVNGQYLNAMPELLYGSLTEVDMQETDVEGEVTLVRNVARVDVILQYEDFDTDLFTQYPDLCFFELWDVPITLKWDGGLYPDKDQPDVATVPLHQTISFDAANGLTADTVRFIVPAHRGEDFAEADPQDITTSLLKLKASLPHPDNPGESFFAEVNGSELIEIPVAPKMNWILEVNFIFHGPLQTAKLDVQVTVKEWDTYEQYENF